MTDIESPFVSVHTLDDRFEADLLMDALEQEGIPAILRSFEETAYTGLFVPQKGWGRILVPEEMVARAEAIIKPLLQEIESPSLYTDSTEVDPSLWERLREADPQKICRNALVEYDVEQEAYVVPFLSSEYLCIPKERAILPVKEEPCTKPDFEFHLVMLHYLLEAKPLEFSGRWISEKDLPSGESFFRGPHSFPVDSLLQLFDSHIELFSQASEILLGREVDFGDAAYQFWVLPRIPILAILWQGDDEFEPSLHILFDDSISSQLKTLDTLWALVNLFCRTLLATGQALLDEEQP
ncbi:MAG: DUF3786 domain-containing protein [Syntrophobacteraceae bacterium]|nr:DUF3786 domain-containing protein [Syntrophobacteraceae bacterium]